MSFVSPEGTEQLAYQVHPKEFRESVDRDPGKLACIFGLRCGNANAKIEFYKSRMRCTRVGITNSCPDIDLLRKQFGKASSYNIRLNPPGRDQRFIILRKQIFEQADTRSNHNRMYLFFEVVFLREKQIMRDTFFAYPHSLFLW
ncbi:MAG: hypothetical protein JWO71_717 [Candidatus Acidoferrum typicum]|nr:hypothetical protein [Candidatus Acidoferrum typicum]